MSELCRWHQQSGTSNPRRLRRCCRRLHPQLHHLQEHITSHHTTRPPLLSSCKHSLHHHYHCTFSPSSRSSHPPLTRYLGLQGCPRQPRAAKTAIEPSHHPSTEPCHADSLNPARPQSGATGFTNIPASWWRRPLPSSRHRSAPLLPCPALPCPPLYSSLNSSEPQYIQVEDHSTDCWLEQISAGQLRRHERAHNM